jgi:hypothetical protein
VASPQLSSSLRIPSDLQINQNELSSGLLLGPDIYHNHRQGINTFDVIALSPNAGQTASLPISDVSMVGYFHGQCRR